MMRLRNLNANDIPPLYVISISLWIKTSFEFMVKGCVPIIYKNLVLILRTFERSVKQSHGTDEYGKSK